MVIKSFNSGLDPIRMSVSFPGDRSYLIERTTVQPQTQYRRFDSYRSLI